jgi:serine/threonine protein kinase
MVQSGEQMVNPHEQNIKKKYKFYEVIGRGATGTVHRAINRETKEIVAIKTIKK